MLGNLTTVLEPDPCITTNTLTTSYTYDWMNHVAGVTMTRPNVSYAANGVCSEIGSPVTQTRTFVYSDAGLLTSATNPENGTVLYYYNTDNTLYYKVDAKGQNTIYSYDSEKRVNTVQHCTGTLYPYGCIGSLITAITYYYDSNPIETGFSQYTAGRLAAVQYSAAGGPYNEEYSYHPAGGLTAKRFQINREWRDDDNDIQYGSFTGNLDLTYSYDSAGRVHSYLPRKQPQWSGSGDIHLHLRHDGQTLRAGGQWPHVWVQPGAKHSVRSREPHDQYAVLFGFRVRIMVMPQRHCLTT